MCDDSPVLPTKKFRFFGSNFFSNLPGTDSKELQIEAKA